LTSKKEKPMATPLPPQQPAAHQQSDAKNTAQSDKNAAATPSGPLGDNPGTAGPGSTAVTSNTPENNLGHLNPSAPEDANTTPGSTGKK
jgi:hypothetical protein